MSTSIASPWKRILSWIEKHAPEVVLDLNDGATDSEIKELENLVECPLPHDFKEFYKLNNGGNFWIPPGCNTFLTLQRIIETINLYERFQSEGDWDEEWTPEVPREIKPYFWSKKRIPFSDNSGFHHMIDLDPTTEGNCGQIIDNSHETGPSNLLANSLSEYLQNLARDLESNKYVSTVGGEIVSPDWL